MSNIITYPTGEDRYVGREFVVGATTKVWDGEKWVNKSFGNHEKRLQKDRQAIEAIYKAKGYNNVFFFEDGFTYTEPNDVGVYEDGTAWAYADAGTLPVTIAANTEPSEPTYNLVSGSRWEGKYKTISIGSEVLDGDIIVDAITGSSYITYPKETIGIVTALDYQELTATIGGVDVFLVGATGGYGDALSWGLEVGESGSHEKNTLIMLNRISKYLSEQGGYMEFPNEVINFGFQNEDTSNAPNNQYILWGEYNLDISGAEKPIHIHFEGTEFTFIEGYRYGSFDPNNPFTPLDDGDGGRFISAGHFMNVELCKSFIATGSATINFNCETAIVGGEAGDTGIQLAGTGVRVRSNDYVEICPFEVLEAPLDGFAVVWNGLTSNSDKKPVILHNPKSVLCGRNNLSVVGCNSLVLNEPVLLDAGMGQIKSLPRSGIDFEPEGGANIRNVQIYSPYIANAYGQCVLNAFNAGEGIIFYGGKIIAGSGYSLFGGMDETSHFYGTAIVGATAQQNGSHNFHNCLLSMDNSDADGYTLLPSRTRMDFNFFSGHIENSEIRANETYSTLPFMTSSTKVVDCDLYAGGDSGSFMRATFIGRNTFEMTGSGRNDFNGALLYGQTIVNGSNVGQRGFYFSRAVNVVTTAGGRNSHYYTSNGFNDSLLSGESVTQGDRAIRHNITASSTYTNQVVTTSGLIGSTAIYKNYGAIQ